MWRTVAIWQPCGLGAHCPPGGRLVPSQTGLLLHLLCSHSVAAFTFYPSDTMCLHVCKFLHSLCAPPQFLTIKQCHSVLFHDTVEVCRNHSQTEVAGSYTFAALDGLDMANCVWTGKRMHSSGTVRILWTYLYQHLVLSDLIPPSFWTPLG